MALNTNGEVESKPGASQRELSQHFYKSADFKFGAAERFAKLGDYKLSVKADREGEDLLWRARGHRVLAFVETAASKIGLEVKF
jgi:hypothetical protein